MLISLTEISRYLARCFPVKLFVAIKKELALPVVLCSALLLFTLWFEPAGAQRSQALTAGDLPNLQLYYITRIPPSQWELQGALAAADFERLLLRHQHFGREFRDWGKVAHGDREYRAEDFDRLSSPDLIKAVLGSGGLEVKQASTTIVMMSQYRYLLPLLVKNEHTQAESLKVQTPFRTYDLVLPAQSVRGFCLNLNGDQVGTSRAKIVLASGTARQEMELTFEIRATGNLRVRLIDQNSQPAAARVYLTGSDGLAHMPIGAAQRIGLTNGEYFFHSGENFEAVLPEGQALIQAVRGIEYAPVEVRADIKAGQTQTIDLRLDHRFPLYKEGWYSGDAHVHANYVNNETIDADEIELQVSAEGLDHANLMVANSYGSVIHDARFFEGKPHRLSQGHRILYWNEEMRNRALYGHMSFFNLKQLVHPLFTGFPGTPNFEDYPPNYVQAQKAQLQKGAVTYVHPAHQPNFRGTGAVGAKEFPVDLALGQVDALDVLNNFNEKASMELWYRALNCGFRCAISAGSDSMTNLMMMTIPGAHRVYVNVPGKFSYDGWVEHYKKGMSFATNGPMLRFSVNGKSPGQDLLLSSQKPATVKIEVEARSIVPMDRLEIVVNGSVVAVQEKAEKEGELRLTREIQLERSSWVAARVLGPPHRLVLNDEHVFAHTGPVYCYFGDEPIRSAADANFWIDWIDQLIASVNERGIFATPEKHAEVIQLFRKAQNVYRERESRVEAHR